MKDRIPKDPGRVLITPENGDAAFYATMTRADNPEQEGTPLNKNSLLKDATAALFGLGADALPDDVLRKIASDTSNLYVWKKTGASYVEIVPTLSGPTGTTYSVGYNNESIQYSDELEVVSGTLKLKNPSTVTITTSNYANYSTLLCGKYFTVTSNNSLSNYLCFGDDTELKIKSNTQGSFVVKGGWYISAYTEKTVTPHYGYVCSFDKNAYPPAVSDGFIYTALGMLGSALESAKIVSGSYTGTGTYLAAGGSDDETKMCSLEFEAPPKVVFIGRGDEDASSVVNMMFIRYAGTRSFVQYCSYTSNDAEVGVKFAGNKVLWRGTSAQQQNNISGRIYNYYAIL